MPHPEEPHPALIDPQRLAALNLTDLMDSPPEAAFDRFTTLVQQILGVPIAMISLLDQNRQFFKSQVGLPEPIASARETPLSYAICQQVVINKVPFIVGDATVNPAIKDNPAVTEFGVMAYAGVPLKTSDDQVIGSFCVLDVQPHEWGPREIEVLTSLAEMVMREVALREVTQKLNAQYKALERTEQQRDGLVHMVVHDLRTPLTALLVGLQTMQAMTVLDETSTQLMDIALRGANSLSEMINTILDVNRAEAGRLDLSCQEVAPCALVEKAVAQVKYLGEQKSLRLECDFEPDLPPFTADEGKLVRVLVNLLGNAIRYTPPTGEIRISVHHQSNEDALVWRVSDNGVGIAAENLESIFEKFEQVEGAHQNQATSGLGLTFCKLVVEAHRGRIWAESEVGQGSQFYFKIPVQQS